MRDARAAPVELAEAIDALAESDVPRPRPSSRRALRSPDDPVALIGKAVPCASRRRPSSSVRSERTLAFACRTVGS